jgi:hypothetical protein
MAVVYVLLARLPADGVQSFQAYEEQVLPLLACHGGRLERRLRSSDGQTEVHLVSFPSVEDFNSYRDDARRAELQGLLQRSGAQVDLHELYDVP